MSWGYNSWRPYVPVAERRAKAAREVARLARKNGQSSCPVVLEGRKIAHTFWGKAWCDNLEAYSDYSNRLPRGRTYVRNGSVVDLRIENGKVTALVSGSSLYRVQIKIKPLAQDLWQTIQTECAGKIDSLIELLQGKLSSAVMQVVTRPAKGLFPTPEEIDLDCSCPDWADLCKHVAASLYGVGAKLDHHPELLFLLRGVDPSDLISKASAAEAVRQTTPQGAPAMSETDMADVFGIELGPASIPITPSESPAQEPLVSSKKPSAAKPTPPRKASGRFRLSAAARAKIASAVKLRWKRLKKAQDAPPIQPVSRAVSKTKPSRPAKVKAGKLSNSL